MESVSEFASRAGIASGRARSRMVQVRQQKILALHVSGMNLSEICRTLHISRRTAYRDLEQISDLHGDDVRVRLDELIRDAGLDAEDLHITLTQMHDADFADICVNPDAPIEELRYKPIAHWPAIWRRGLAGKVRIIPVAIRDGERTPGGDKVEYRVEIERESLLKILELAAKLRVVDALGDDAHAPDSQIQINIVHINEH